MLVNHVPMVDSLVIGTGQPWDIFFFVSEVMAGGKRRCFSEAYCSMPYAYRILGFACIKAMLARCFDLHHRINAARFVVVRLDGRVAGAVLLREVDVEDGRRAILIEYLVVTLTARRRGIGETLVEYVKRLAPVGGVECYCTVESRAMQRLLKRKGFVRTHRAKVVDADGAQFAVPSRWRWES